MTQNENGKEQQKQCQNDAMMEQIITLQKENDALKQDYNELKLMFTKSYRNEDTEKDTQDDNVLYQSLYQSNEEYLNLYVEKQKQHRETVQLYQDQIYKLQNTLEEKNKQIKQLTEQVNELNSKNALFKQGIDDARNDILELDKMNDEMDYKWRIYVQQLQQENEQLKYLLSNNAEQFQSKPNI